jgi:transposase
MGLRLHYDAIGISAATLLTATGANPERLRSYAGFAALFVVSPPPASSGKTNWHRLNRREKRQDFVALHLIVVVKHRLDEEIQDYPARRTEEGLSKPEILHHLNV